MFTENDRISIQISERSFSGAPTWSDESGFRADLTTLSNSVYELLQYEIPIVVPAILNESRRVFLYKPNIRSIGGEKWRVGDPISANISISALSVIYDVPWDMDVSEGLHSVQLFSNAFSLWYGMELGKIENDYERYAVSAFFSAEQESVTSSFGVIDVGNTFSGPSWPTYGKYVFELKPYIRIKFEKLNSISDVVDLTNKIEMFFELLVGFPQRDYNCVLKFNGVESRTIRMKVALRVKQRSQRDHPLGVFIEKKDISDLSNHLELYVTNYDSIKLLQNTLMYLANDRVMLPEGFLTACNIIESIGKNATPDSTDFINTIEEVKDYLSQNDKGLYKKFVKYTDGVERGPSFNDKFKYCQDIIEHYGVQLKINRNKIKELRAKYRHDINGLTAEELESMSDFIRFVWVFGIVYICRMIEIPEATLRNSLRNSSFHFQRATGFSQWGSLES
jgi:hypothetical protein